jgi:hypothetical protein
MGKYHLRITRHTQHSVDRRLCQSDQSDSVVVDGRREMALRLLAIFICFLADSAYSCSPSHNSADSKVAEPANSARGGIVCKLATLRDRYRVGDRPEISARIINGTEKAIYLVGSLDGSERKARFPHVYYSVSGVEGRLSETRFGY